MGNLDLLDQLHNYYRYDTQWHRKSDMVVFHKVVGGSNYVYKILHSLPWVSQTIWHHRGPITLWLYQENCTLLGW